MLRKKIINTIVVVLFFMFYGVVCVAYDSQTTHPNFTDITVELYNLQSVEKILQAEKYWIKKGSMDEDNGIRSINHFYDPIYNRSWKLGGFESLIKEETSIIWFNDQLRQSSYDTAFLAALQIKNMSYLESNANQTYNRAIYEYLKGNKKEAFYALGHTLHLLQDLTSVPHVRADVHFGKNDESNYEIRSSYKTVDDFKMLFNKLKIFSIVKRNSVEDYFYNLALYTNNNFYSEDTISAIEYQKPEIYLKNIAEITNNNSTYYWLGWDEEKKDTYKLVKQFGGLWKINTSLNAVTVDDPLVFEDYWVRLSKKAVLEGAGLLDLFFKDVEMKRDDPSFFIMMEKKQGVKFFENFIGDIKQIGIYINGLLNKHAEDVILQPPNTINKNFIVSTSKQQNLVDTTTRTSSTTKLIIPQKTTTTTIIKKITTTTKKTTTTTKKVKTIEGSSAVVMPKCDFVLNADDILEVDKKVIFNELAWMGSLNNFSDEWIELKNISNERIDISLWEIINKDKTIKIVFPSGTMLNPSELYLVERTDDNTVLHVKTDLIFKGAVKNENEELRLLNNNCIMVDRVLSNVKWPAGNSETKRTMERKNDFSWYTSSAICINGVCGSPKSENSLFSEEYNKDDSSVVTTSTTIITTTTTSLPLTTTTTMPIEEMELKKIVFSEIKLSGENADDEFVELYNPLNEDIDLTGWSIKQKTSDINNLVSNEFLANKIIPAHGYFLIVNKQENKYTGEIISDTTFNSDSYNLIQNQALILYDNYDREIDRIGWGSERISHEDCENNCLTNLNGFESFERKANELSTFETMFDGVDKLLANSYDSQNNLFDFVIRNISDPQNSHSLIEPREEAEDISNGQKNDLNISNFIFYYLNDKKQRAFIRFDINQYPFWDIDEDEDDKWRAMVFYLNSSDGKELSLTRDRNDNDIGYAGWQVTGNSAKVLLIKYKVCKGGFNIKYGTTFDSALILPHNTGAEGGDFICNENNVSTYYGVPNSIAYNNTNNNFIELEIIGTLGPNYERNYNIENLFQESDYITIGFYKGKNDHFGSNLDTTELIFEDNNKYFLNNNEFKKINVPQNLIVSYDQNNYQYNLSWDMVSDENGIDYNVCVSNVIDTVGNGNCYGAEVIKEGEKRTMSILLENIPYFKDKIYFGVKVLNLEYELVSDFSNIVEENVYEMPRNINNYISNVNWTVKNERMILEIDLNRVGKFIISGNLDHFVHELLSSWDYKGDVGLNTYSNPNVELINGAISDYTCGGQKNNSRLRLFNYNNPMTTGKKEFLIRFLSHPLLKDKYLYNPDGLTLTDLNKLIKSDDNPDGILNSLSEMFLTLNYGVRYETYCGYWTSDNNFTSFTNDTNFVPNQVKYNFNLP